MNILGIDPGIGRIGWGVIGKKGQQVKSIAYDCFETNPKDITPQRLSLIYHEIIRLIRKYEPSEVAIEDLFFNTNAKTAFIVGQARGVILLAINECNLTSTIYTPLQVKVALTGFGHAPKTQVGKMVTKILKLPSIPTPDDTADALAIALTHAYTMKK